MANRSPYVGMRTNRFPSTKGIVPWSQLSWISTQGSSKRLWDPLVKKSIRRCDYDNQPWITLAEAKRFSR